MQGTYGNGRLVTVFGGSGFVGRHVVRALAMQGYRIRVAVRRPELAGFLRPLGMVGQVQPIQANLRYPESVAAALQGSVAVVNSVGILLESGKQTFETLQVDGAETIARAAADAGVERLVHVSALGADRDSPSLYAETKAKGEAAVESAFQAATIVRPSIQFGVGDSFFSKFASIARLSPIVPLVGPQTKFQPVYVGDVASLIQQAVDGTIPMGRTYELGGPEVLTFRECMEEMLRVIGRRRLLVSVPFPIARILGGILQFLPGRLLTPDQVKLLRSDNVVSPSAKTEGRTFEGVGINPTAMEAILPTYLSRFRVRGQFTSQRNA